VDEAAPLVVLDTDLVSTAVYSRHYYGDCPAWIEEKAARRQGQLYLLHHVDVTWVEDGRQREQPERRPELFERFRATLEATGARVVPIRGSWDERRRRAVQAVDGLLQVPAQPAGERG
jgi:nicotinamide riboside kinase